MIIIDYNGIAVGNVITQRLDLQEDLIRHMILNTIRMYNVKFKDNYGPEVVIALEGGSWRKDYFPQYKANRKKSRDKDTMDWDKLYEIINKSEHEAVLATFGQERVIKIAYEPQGSRILSELY